MRKGEARPTTKIRARLAETAAWSAAVKLGDQGRRELRGHELQFYLDDLMRTRSGPSETQLVGQAEREIAGAAEVDEQSASIKT